MYNRKENNLAIVGILREIVHNNPDLRFRQILSILELDKDNFYEEPDETLQKIINNESYKQLLCF